jgi:site-specific recombinase XerD
MSAPEYLPAYTLDGERDEERDPIYLRTLDKPRTKETGRSQYHVICLRYPKTVRQVDGSLDPGLVQEAKLEAEAQLPRIHEARVLRYATTMQELCRRRLRQVRREDHTVSYRKAERGHARRWREFLGDEADPSEITADDLKAFATDRASGRIDARGQRMKRKKDWKPVRQRTVEADLRWLKQRLDWAVRNDHLREHRLRGDDVRAVMQAYKEHHPRRPVAAEGRYQRTLAKADLVMMDVGKKKVRSYLRELLILAHESGHRIGQICRLRVTDVHLQSEEIRWVGEHAKTGEEVLQPMTDAAREAITSQLARRFELFGPAGVESPWLFPAPRRRSEPCGTSNASRWLKRAEKLANLAPLDGSLWHAYRRKWASERRHQPDEDVAALGGWRDPSVMRQAYQHSDPTKRRQVMEDRRPWEGDAE